MPVSYAANDADEDELARWYRRHRWLGWGCAGLFFGWCVRGGFGQGGWEPIGATWVYYPPSPVMIVLGWLIQALGGMLLLWGLGVTLKRRKRVAACGARGTFLPGVGGVPTVPPSGGTKSRLRLLAPPEADKRSRR